MYIYTYHLLLCTAESQDFKGFYTSSRVCRNTVKLLFRRCDFLSSQYWRLVVADNYGDNRTAILSEVQFFGVGKATTTKPTCVSLTCVCVCVCVCVCGVQRMVW